MTEPQKLDLHPLLPEFSSWQSLNCPLPECGHELSIKYYTYVALGGENFNTGKAPSPSDIDVSDWKVECLRGHVLLVPTDYVDMEDEDPVESDETRIFTDKDMQRLIKVLKIMNVDWDIADVAHT